VIVSKLCAGVSHKNIYEIEHLYFKIPTWLAEYSSTVNVLRIVCMSDYVRYGIQFLALASFVEIKLSGVRIG
jgi:hypothetical protein